ncbi:MAG TPA: hypothetical protein VN641_14875 [Urbifossiella sp.]|nr:hypothetical protein [Urbifossiella sp.]
MCRTRRSAYTSLLRGAAMAPTGKDRLMSRVLLLFAALIGLSLTLMADAPKANPFRGEQPVPAPPPIQEAEGDRDFKLGEYRKAATWYAGMAAVDASILSAEQKKAWAFCRLKLAAESLTPECDAIAAAAADKEAGDALALAPESAEVRKLARTVLLLARQRLAMTGASVDKPAWETLESASFLVKFQGPREWAEQIAAAAESKRAAIFERWSGPVGGAWSPRCTIVMHPSPEAYAAATGKPAAGLGHATVRLVEGKATERQIDLCADDANVLENALPRELTHVVLAELFPYSPPPKWAEEGMAVLAESADEVDRYRRTCVKCGRAGQLFTVAALLEMKEFPAADKITGYYCGSISLVDYLVRLKGEKHFTTFLRDCHRYGSAAAVKRHYDFATPKALQDAWLKSAIR